MRQRRFRTIFAVTLFACTLVYALLLSPHHSWGESGHPAPGAKANASLQIPDRINSLNAEAMKELIVPELLPLVRAGTFEMVAAPNTKSPLTTGSLFERRAAAATEDILLKNGGLKSTYQATAGLPFGGGNSISRDEDPSRISYKALWSTHAIWWNQMIHLANFDLVTLSSDATLATLGGSLSRVYPALVTSEIPPSQLFRERIAITAPSEISPFIWLTFRFFSDEEDMVWVYSSALQRARQIAGANRSDALANSTMSADDIYTWSGKPELADATLLGITTILAPVADLEITEASPVSPADAAAPSPGGSCWQVNGGETRTRALFNFENRRFPQALGWIPSGATFVPRKVWRIEITNRDPFSSYGRQVLYLDYDLLLPLYKIVYDKAGNYWKTVITAFGIAATPDGSKTFAYGAYTVVEDRMSKASSMIVFPKIVFCNNFTPSLQLSDFDPQKLGGAGKAPTL